MKGDRTIERLRGAFDAMPAQMRRRFVNAIVSDQGPQNPKLGNRAPQRNAPLPPTSGMSGLDQPEWDYFRDEKPPGQGLNPKPADSITPARVTLSVRMRWNPIKGLTPERVVSFLDQWRFGFFRMAGMMWDQMERRDYQLKITAPKRKKSVARHGYEVLTLDNIDPSLEAMAEDQNDFLSEFYDKATVTTALDPDEVGGVSLLLRQMMDAQLKYYAVHDIVWQPKPDGSLTAKFIFCPIWWFEGTRGKLRFLDSEFQVYGRDMAPGEWLVTCGDGLMECISLIYTFKWLAMKSWLALLDKFGQPGIHGKTDATVGSKEWNEFVAAVQDFSQEWAAVTNRSGEIALVEAKTTTSGNGPFDPMVEKLDRAITQLMRGGDLGTSSGQNRQGASLQEDESEILETDDNKVLEETLALKVTRYAIAWKFGPDAPVLVYIKLRTTPRRDLQNDIAVDEFLLGAGAPLGTNATLERYNRPVPDKGDELLKPPMPPKPAGPKPGENNPSQTTANPEFGKSFANVGGAQRSASPTSDKELLIQAALTEFKGINARLEAISRITDPEVQRSKLASVMADLDALEKQLSSAPEVARAIYRILVQGVGNGIEEAAKAHGGKDTQVKPGLNG